MTSRPGKASAMGHVFLAGAGPGDPGLITIAGRDAIGAADLVVYDALVPAALLRFAPPGAERVFAGKRAGAHAMDQREIEQLLIDRARAGDRVVRLKGGDPFVFGRGGEEALALARAAVPFTVIPGISSAIAAAAYAGIPVTHREVARSVLIMTAHSTTTSQEWEAAARAGTSVLLMTMDRLPQALDELVAAGLDRTTPAAAVRWGTRADQEVVTATVETLAQAVATRRLTSPAAVIVGDVVRLREDLAWFKPGPLAGMRVAVLRPAEASTVLSGRLEAVGATVVEAPVIETRLTSPPAPWPVPVTKRYEWVVFLSGAAVRGLMALVYGAGGDARWLSQVSIAATGPGTVAELGRHGLKADFVPSRPGLEAMAVELPARAGERVLHPASAQRGPEFRDALVAREVHCDRVTVYETVPVPLPEARMAELRECHVVAFTSRSTVHALADIAGGSVLPGVALVSIGRETSEALRARFGRVDREAATATLDALAAAIEDVLRAGGRD